MLIVNSQAAGTLLSSVNVPALRLSRPCLQVIVEAGSDISDLALPFSIACEASPVTAASAPFSWRPDSNEENDAYVNADPATNKVETMTTRTYSTSSATNREQASEFKRPRWLFYFQNGDS